jgi:2-polyprenyl-6-methoxyphenol hydroxylase-like FAD-dependent oxidoreductase
MQPEFLIVGGGIGGAVLGCLLTRAGRRVLVLERSPSPQPITRPEILWPETVRFLRTLLPAEHEHLWLLPVRGLAAYENGRELVRVTPEFFDQAGVQPYSTAAHETRRLLLEQSGCEVLRGVEVTNLLKEGTRVVGVKAQVAGDERQWRGVCTIGDDGGNSLVRRECGIRIRIHDVGAVFLSFGADWPESLPAATVHLWINACRLKSGVVVCGFIPQPGGRGAGIIAVRPRVLADPVAVSAALAEFAAQDPRLEPLLTNRRFPQDFLRYPLHYGNSAHYAHPGAALLGDAAHPVTPAGGQGANLAIADARALASALLAGSPPALREYEGTRRRAAERSLSLSRGVAAAFALPDGVVFSALPWVLRLGGHLPRLAGIGLRRISRAFH